MTAQVVRFAARLLAVGLIAGGVRAVLAAQPVQVTPPRGIHGEGEPEPMSLPAALARTAIPPAAASGLIVLGGLGLEAADPALALRVARFTNLALASLLASNGVGSVVFVQPALASLAEGEYFRSEQALSRHYSEIMRPLMPASVVSGLMTLWLLRDQRSAASFRLTLAATAGLVGMLATTALELPMNKRTLKAPSETLPPNWLAERAQWNRFNQLRTVCEVVTWGCICLDGLADGEAAR